MQLMAGNPEKSKQKVETLLLFIVFVFFFLGFNICIVYMLILNFTNFTFLTDSMAKNITKIFTFLLSTQVLFTWTANFVPFGLCVRCD